MSKVFPEEPISAVTKVITSPVDKNTLPDEIPVFLCNYIDVYYNSTITGDMQFMEATATKNEIDRFSLRPNDVVITKDSESADDIGVPTYIQSIRKNLLCGYHLAILRPKKNVDGKFLSFALTHPRASYDFYRYANGITRFGLTNEVYRKVKIPLPSLPEQKAIADLLSTWDEAIEKTERLIQAKEANLKGHIQRTMGNEAINANGWPMTRLGELFVEISRKVGERELIPYSISAGIGFVSQHEKWGKDISGSQYKNYTHLKAGEFSYNKGNSKQYQQGCVYLLKDGEICVPNVFISFKPRTKNVVPEFFEHYFIANYHARELRRYITSGARSDGLLNLNKKDFFKIMVPCPSPDEQKAIAEALTALQHEIDLLKQLADKYKAQKRGLMQKLLTGEWRIKPEIVQTF